MHTPKINKVENLDKPIKFCKDIYRYMKRNRIQTTLVLFLLCLLPYFLEASDVSQIERTQEILQKEKELRERIEKDKEKPQIEEELPLYTPLVPTEKIFIQKIRVTDVHLLSEGEINQIILPFEGKELGLEEMQKVVELITDTYRKKGYVTCRAYLPPQKIEDNLLEIRVLEGIMGDLEIIGNRYFKTSLIKERIKLNKGEPFNYNLLRRSLTKLNEHPDRNSRAVLKSGKEPRSTDIVLEVKDQLPVHIGFNFDNFGSRYIEKDRYQTTLTHNNFLGLDDIFTLQYQVAAQDAYRLTSFRYLFPLTDFTKLGFYAGRTKSDLGREYKDLGARGKSQLYCIYSTQSLVEEENIVLILNLGFDYKDITNFQLGEESSCDRLRIVKIGFDWDVLDSFGRTILSNQIDFGIPNIMGGSKETYSQVDFPGPSRQGSGGKFVKDTINLLRLQRMPFSSTLLWKNQVQISPYILSASEQFQLGGISNVRGYPVAEYVGDKGYAVTFEWSFPPYFIPKGIKMPFGETKLYDALRLITFYDWGNVRLNHPQTGEEKYNTLRAVGCGLRFNLPQDFSVRLDLAWPLDKTPSDENHFHPWIGVSKSF